MAKKNIMCRILVVLMAFCLVGCNGTVNNTDSEYELPSNTENSSEVEGKGNQVEYKEVVFLNRYHAEVFETTADVKPDKNEVRNLYDRLDKTTLYAFAISSAPLKTVVTQKDGESKLEYIIRREKAESEYTVEKALEMGLMVMIEHPYCIYQNEHQDAMLEAKYGDGSSVYSLMGDCVVVGTLEQISGLFGNTEPIDGYIWGATSVPRPDLVDIMKEMELSEKEIKQVYAGMKVRTEEFDANLGTESEVTLTVPVIMPNETTETD